MAGVVEIDTTQLRPVIEALRAAPRVITAVARSVMRRAMALAERSAKLKVTNDLLKVRSGMLRRSIAFKVESDAAAIVGRLGILKAPNGLVLTYAAVHEFGSNGPIRASKQIVEVARSAWGPGYGGGGLYIPIGDNLTGAGVQKLTPQEAFEEGGFVQYTPRGNFILFLRDGDALKPMFVIKNEVPAIPAQHYIGSSIDEIVPYIADAIGVVLESRLLSSDAGSGSADLGGDGGSDAS